MRWYGIAALVYIAVLMLFMLFCLTGIEYHKRDVKCVDGDYNTVKVEGLMCEEKYQTIFGYEPSMEVALIISLSLVPAISFAFAGVIFD